MRAISGSARQRAAHPALQIIRSPWTNILFFNLAWALCVVGGNDWLPLTLPLIAIYFACTIRSGGFALRAVIVPACLGILIDALLTRQGVFVFDGDVILIPVWLITLWFAFASTLTSSLSFLQSRPWLAAMLGALGFAFAYGVGHRLGAVEFGLPIAGALALIAGIWAVLLPLVYKWLDWTGASRHS